MKHLVPARRSFNLVDEERYALPSHVSGCRIKAFKEGSSDWAGEAVREGFSEETALKLWRVRRILMYKSEESWGKTQNERPREFIHSFIYWYSPGLLFSLHLSCHEFIGNGFQQLRLLSIGSQCISLGGASECFGWIQLPFFLASFSSWSFSFTCFRKLSQPFECLIHSLFTLALLARILLVTHLFTTMSTPCWVIWGIPFEQCPFPWGLQYHLPVDLHVYGQRNNKVF